MRCFALTLLVGCSGSAAYEATAVTVTPCTNELKQPGDEVAFSEASPGILEARLIRAGKVVAWGRARRLADAETKIVVRAVGVFTPLCAPLRDARAGHAAVTMADGGVHLSGGYRPDGAGRFALRSTDLYDAWTGTFSAGVEMTLSGGTQIPKAFHTGTLLPNGMLLLMGGERYSPMPAAQTAALIFDPSMGAFGAIPSRASPPSIARTRHVAVSTPTGVLIAGGMRGQPLTPVLELERFDPATIRMDVGPTPASPITGGVWAPARSQAALIAGTTIVLVDAQLNLFPQAVTLTRSRSAVQLFARENELIVAGDGTSEIVDLATQTVVPGPALPSAPGSCAVQLSGNRWLFMSGSSATMLRWSGGYTVTTIEGLGIERTEAACAVLGDGSVLLAGGIGAGGAALGNARIFTPPVD